MPFSIYLHFPFCRNRCGYCDFYKELHDDSIEAQFFDALKIETELIAESQAELDNKIQTIYIGGGTPSLMVLERFRDWIEQLKRQFVFLPDIEFSFENNPESVTLELMQALKEIGVTRPTFGLQSFDQKLLKSLDRIHNSDDSQRSIYCANVVGFKTFGVDLLFGMPTQGSEQLSKDLDQLHDLNPPHVSFYHLIVEPGTKLESDVASGRVRMPDDSLTFSLYRAGVEFFEENDLPRYEVCSFAKPEHECRHNLNYWEGGDYLAFGPSGHSFINGERFANVSNLREYIATLKNGQRPLVEDKSGIEERITETIMLGLRMTKGIDRRKFAKRFGCKLEERLVRRQYDLLIESGHLIPDRGSLRLSDDGMLLVDEITQRLVR